MDHVARRARRFTRPAFLPAILALGLVVGGISPALADDGDGGGGGGGPGGSGGGAGAGGGGGGAGGDGGGSETGGGVRGFDLGPNPGTNPIRDAGRLVRSIFGGTTPPAVAAAAPPPPPPPAPRAAPPTELVALQVPPAALPQLRAAGFAVLGERRIADGSLLLRLRAPQSVGPAAAIARVRGLAPGAVVDRNHLFRPVEATAPAPEGAPQDVAEAAPRAGCTAPPASAVALIDTAVDPAHPDLAGMRLERETLRGAGRRPSRPMHGTAVAARLAQLLPGGRLVALDAFHLGPDGEAADAFDVAMAIDRAVALGAGVVNLSFAGPANAVVAQIGAAAAARGAMLVAAAGNDGPRAAPRYPAAYPWAVAVTAVRRDSTRWDRAPIGAHIAFAAHGVDVPVPQRAGAPPRLWSGTSFAAPVVSATLALLPPGGSGSERVEALARHARDLGVPGRDTIFGWGRLEVAMVCAPGTTLVASGG